jgi:hypothetical protein
MKTLKVSRKAIIQKLVSDYLSKMKDSELLYEIDELINPFLGNDNLTYKFEISDNGEDDEYLQYVKPYFAEPSNPPFCPKCNSNHKHSGIADCDVPIETW